MRVAFYNHTSAVSGGEINLLQIASHLTAAKPVVFAPEGELLDRARREGLETVCLPSYRARMTKNPFLLIKHMAGMLGSGFRFAQAMRRHKIDVIHANSLRAGIMAALFTWWHRRPLIWHAQDIPPKGMIGSWINRLAQFTVKAIICISDSVLRGFDQRKLADRLHLVHNGVRIRSLSELERRKVKKRMRAELATPLSSKLVVIIGQITPWKRQADALHAVGKLLKKGHDVYIWVVGEAKFREENSVYWESLRRQTVGMEMQDRVKFTGFRDDVLEICCAADLLFLCSDNEPFGRVIIEAMSQSVPVVATNAGGVPEIVEHEQSGLLYEVGDIDGLVRCSDYLLSHDSVRKKMGSNAAEHVKAHFAIQSAVAKIQDVYRIAAARPAAAKVKRWEDERAGNGHSQTS